jgi:hypothetical protein
VSVAAAEAAGMATDQLVRRTVEIRGRTEPIEVVVLLRLDGKVSRDEHHVGRHAERCPPQPSRAR